jgi:hypothetical protein
MKYNAKNHGAWFLNWLRFKAFSFVKNRQKGTVDHSKKNKKILIYPACKSPERLFRLLLKTAYAFPRNNHIEFHIMAPETAFNTAQKNIKKLLAAGNHKIDTLKISRHESNSKTEFKSYDLILCHRANALPGIFKYFHKTEIIDEGFYSHAESLVFQKAYYWLINDNLKASIRRISDRNFSRLFTKLADKKSAYCFLTGPSISRYRSIHINPDAVKMICNSLVKNKTFLSFIGGPDIITFADPVFHFGASEYAIKFCEYLMEVVIIYKPFVVIPEFTAPLLLAWFPELEPYLIGLQTTERQDFNLPSPDNPQVRATDNIMTIFMLPLAAALADHISIAGADGREKQETYFWKFSHDSQFTEAMESVYEYHPSFFRDRNYVDYYEAHCRLVEDIIQHIEKKDKSVTSETPSFIPALSKRFKKPSS